MASLNKEELRRTARAVRDGLSCERHKEAVERVAAQLVELSELRSARRVLVYATLPGELNCLRWLEEGTVLVSPTGDTRTVPSLVWPRVAGSELTLHACTEAELIPGSFGLSEPPADAPLVALSDIDVALVPGLAFDAQGYRIGYGKGYYDRLLADAPAGLLTIGLCFKEVYYPEIAHDAYDIPVRRVVRG